ncbi:ATP-binding cassette, subfamily C [Cribrihabitans marinus]|uniref:ATP-binding cassette, subfamily C n=1 Tax=Cribrihabitans marinus TaxID=1227549 RepID=A0A1H7E3B0_9RHOB|nr:type I secretion system permease/ATPase [Cribrihabitans marinus]GGH41102.1 protease/lipase ABC transporter permease/ATP-binding protein [Cribrihabitans marinus]SEK06512.1 ATP-binding cassette, subfamily C [Cribrihabitans marinus]
MAGIDRSNGLNEMRDIRRESRRLLWAAGLFSVFVNLLMLTGPLFMLQIYDRVLGSRSEETLVALFALMAFLFFIMGVLDWSRGRLLARMGTRFQARLDRRVFDAILRKAARGRGLRDSDNQLKDLEAVQRFFSSPVLAAIFDLPWTPIFLLGISIFHPWLGMLAVGGGGLLIIITVLNQVTTRSAVIKAGAASYQSERMSEHLITEAEMVRSLGMQENSFNRWHLARRRALEENLRANDMGGSFSSITKTFRLFLQSAMLGLGAYLVLQEQLSPGAMIAGSILLGRALAPVDQVIGQWTLIQRAKRGWDNLAELLSLVPAEAQRLELPRPQARLQVQQLTVVPPGAAQASLRLINFELLPGQAMGVIGPSGSGKSTLARALTGVWPAAGGKIRLDGAALEQYVPEVLAQYIGYLPQRVQLFDGTIAENIARLSMTPNDAEVVEAAKKAAAHEMILRLPDGYDTPVSVAGGQLSGGQVQRIGLARAMYGNPMLLVLDEPNSNLDNEGSTALNKAIRQMKEEGRSVLIMAHRPAAIMECDLLLVLEDGMRKAWGPRDQVLSKVVQNHQQIQQAANKPVGVT